LALSKSGIEYLTHCWNIYPGCNHWKTGVCPVGGRCWAKGMATRFRGGNFEPHLIPEKLLDPLKGRQGGRRIGVCFTGDLFGEWVDPDMEVSFGEIEQRDTDVTISLKHYVFDWVIKARPQDTFVFLTKNPKGLLKWGRFPDNAWVGVSVCNDKMLDAAVDNLEDIEAKHKWISFEPLAKKITLSLDYALYYSGVSWIVIGGWDRGKTQPQISWIKEIVEAADRTGIPVFLKDNLLPLLKNHNAYPWAFTPNSVPTFPTYRQEFPKEAQMEMEKELRERIALLVASHINGVKSCYQVADEIIDLLAKEGYGKMVIPEKSFVMGVRVHPIPQFVAIK